MFARFSLKTKLLSLCLLLAAMSGIVGTFALLASREISKNYEHVATINLPNATILADMGSDFQQMRTLMTSLGVEGVTAEAIDNSLKDYHEVLNKYIAANKVYSEVPFVLGEQELYDKTNEGFLKTKALGDKIILLASSKEPQDRQKMLELIMNDYNSLAKSFETALTNLISFQVKQSENWVVIAHEGMARGQFISMALSIGAFLIALVLGYVFSSSLSRTLNQLADRLSGGASEVASASLQISGVGADLSSSATEQAAALQETVSSIDEISAMVNKNAENARRSQEIANISHQVASKGKEAVGQMLTSIEDISRSNGDIMRETANSNEEFSNIVKVISEIGNKTKVINDIVFQTKLLSFNASVEAARAGEHGKGFSVVAEEVGNLAQMSGNAAKEISQLLEESIRKVERTVTETKARIESLIVAGKEKIDSGLVTANRCGESLDEIVKNVSDLKMMVTEISTASQEQALGVQEITRAMNQLDQVTQQNASATQEAASATDELNEQAAFLRTMVNNLVQTVQGSGHQSAVETLQKPEAPKANARVFRMKQKPKVATPGRQKAVVGSDVAPSEDDSRFSDV